MLRASRGAEPAVSRNPLEIRPVRGRSGLTPGRSGWNGFSDCLWGGGVVVTNGSIGAAIAGCARRSISCDGK